MKRVLRLIVVVLAIAGMFWGTRILINNKRNETYVYNNLEWSSEYSISNIDNNLQSFYSYIDDAGATVPDSIKNSIASGGEYYKIKELYAQSEQNFAFYKNKTSLIRTTTKDAQDSVLESYKQFVLAVKNQKEAVQKLCKYLQITTSVSDSNFEYYFGQVEQSSRTMLNSLASLNSKMENYVYKEVYNKKYFEFSDVKNALQTQMLNAYCNNMNLKSDLDKLNNKLDALNDSEQCKLVVQYGQVSDITDLLKAENKSEFITNRRGLINIAKTLFDVEPEGAE